MNDKLANKLTNSRCSTIFSVSKPLTSAHGTKRTVKMFEPIGANVLQNQQYKDYIKNKLRELKLLAFKENRNANDYTYF